MTKRTLVVGGGVIGLCIAYRLMRRGAQVRVLQAVRPNASLAAAGMLPPALESCGAGAHPDLANLLKAAARRWPSFAKELGGIDAEHTLGYRKVGSLVTAPNEAGQNRLPALAKTFEMMGFEVDTLSAAEMRRREPEMSRDVLGALFLHDDALVEPPLLIAALTDALSRGGVQIVVARAVGLDANEGSAVLHLADGGVERADLVVLAPGWSRAPYLAPELSSLFPVKGQILTVVSPIRLGCMVRGEGIYLAPRGDGRIEIGATSERGVENIAIDASAAVTLQAKAVKLIPALAQATPIASRAGVRPTASDQAPILGRSRLSDAVFLAAGAYRNGVLLAPFIADVLADTILGEGAPESMAWLERLSGQRFEV